MKKTFTNVIKVFMMTALLLFTGSGFVHAETEVKTTQEEQKNVLEIIEVDSNRNKIDVLHVYENITESDANDILALWEEKGYEIASYEIAFEGPGFIKVMKEQVEEQDNVENPEEQKNVLEIIEVDSNRNEIQVLDVYENITESDANDILALLEEKGYEIASFVIDFEGPGFIKVMKEQVEEQDNVENPEEQKNVLEIIEVDSNRNEIQVLDVYENITESDANDILALLEEKGYEIASFVIDFEGPGFIKVMKDQAVEDNVDNKEESNVDKKEEVDTDKKKDQNKVDKEEKQDKVDKKETQAHKTDQKQVLPQTGMGLSGNVVSGLFVFLSGVLSFFHGKSKE